MKIVFFGSGKFAVNILRAVHTSNHTVVHVVTQPDRKKGRHLHLAATPVKEYALGHGLDLFQPEDINNDQSSKILKGLEADIFIVVSYGRILSKEILSIPKKMSVNIHASLLPKYRGAAPIQWALVNGESKTGVTFIRMNEFMDRGDIILKKNIGIDKNDRFDTLEEKLSRLASTLTPRVIALIEKNRVRLRKQGAKGVSYAPRIKKQDGSIHWEVSSQDVFNRFRGCFGWPGTFTLFKGKILKVLDMDLGKGKGESSPGEIICVKVDSLEVACLCGSVVIKEVLPESHHRMSVKSFIAGHQVKTGDVLGA